MIPVYNCMEAIALPQSTPCYHKLIPSAVNIKKWDTKEDKGKSMMCTLYILWCICQAKTTLNKIASYYRVALV